MKKIVLSLFLGFSILFGMEFGQMGSQSFGMAGTGVAVKNNQWALFYNPSLLATTTKDFYIQLYGDISTKNKNFNKLFSIDLNNPSEYLTIIDILKDNSLFIGSQVGAVVGFNNYTTGGFAVGSFLTVQAYGSATINTITQDIQSNYTTLFLLEIPVGYAYEFVTYGGDISIGITGKYMSLSRNGGDLIVNNSTNMADSIKNFISFDMNNRDDTFGIDLGLSYEPFEWWNIGFVAKNVNTPKFTINGKDYEIEPQFRAGTSFNWGFFTLALDGDITPNKALYNPNFESQLISVGTMMDFEWFALRGGVSYDLKHTDDIVYALGLGITVFDIGIQFGSKTNPVNGTRLPDYIAIQVGLGFSF